MNNYFLNSEEQEAFETLKHTKLNQDIIDEFAEYHSGIFNPMYGVSQTEYQKQSLSISMTGCVMSKTKTGEILKVKLTDQRYISGELVGIAKNKIAVKDIDGNFYQVDKTDPRYIYLEN